MKKDRPIEEEIELDQEEGRDMTAKIVTDPMGSYTGRPTEKWEMPVQDADDL